VDAGADAAGQLVAGDVEVDVLEGIPRRRTAVKISST
jgi:hypothetical protein